MKIGANHHHKGNLCVCGRLLDSSTAIDGNREPPTAGDIGICWYCDRVYQFNATLTTKLLPESEWDDNIRKTVKMVKSRLS